MCTRCPLHAAGNGPVPFTGRVPAELAILGEAPGRQEDEIGKPFQGPAGRYMRQQLKGAGIDPDAAFICNTVSCYPRHEGASTAKPYREEIVACGVNCDDQLRLSGARFVLLFGSVPLQRFRPDLTIGRMHGRPFLSRDGYVMFSAYHPSYALRKKGGAEAFYTDIQEFAKVFATRNDPNPLAWHSKARTDCVGCGRTEEEAEWVRWNSDGLIYCDRCWKTDVEFAVELVRHYFPGAYEVAS